MGDIDLKNYSVYKDDIYYYFDPFPIFCYVKQYSELINQKIYESQKSFYSSLRTEGLLEAFPNGKFTTNSKRFKGNQTTIDLIVIEKNKFDNFNV